MKFPAQVKTLVAEKLATERLPIDPPAMTTTSHGSGAPCDACDEPIRPAEVECLCEFPLHSELRFHVDCFKEWRRQQDAR